MSDALLESRRWSRTKWGAALLGIVAIHVLAIFALSKRGPIARPAPLQLSKTYFVGEPDPASRLAELLALQDPLVFVEMKPQSISGLLATAQFSFELTNWTEPYRW